MSETIKKYPVFYNGEEYEIRIEQPYIKYYGYNSGKYIIIYKVTKHKQWFKPKFTYKKVYEIDKDSLLILNNKENNIGIYFDSDNYYIQLFKKAFDLYKDKLKLEQKEERKLAALQNWDGII